jgi:hypothetical protein
MSRNRDSTVTVGPCGTVAERRKRRLDVITALILARNEGEEGLGDGNHGWL